jgi:hypothetical protein
VCNTKYDKSTIGKLSLRIHITRRVSPSKKMGELNDLEFPNYSDKLPVLRIFIRTVSLLIIRLLRLAITFTRPLVLISLNARNPCLIFLTICKGKPGQRGLSERIKDIKIKPHFSAMTSG